jgi:hypothetical protein
LVRSVCASSDAVIGVCCRGLVCVPVVWFLSIGKCQVRCSCHVDAHEPSGECNMSDLGYECFFINCCHHFLAFFSGLSWKGHFSLDVEMVHRIGLPSGSESPVAAGCSNVVPFISEISAMLVT